MKRRYIPMIVAVAVVAFAAVLVVQRLTREQPAASHEHAATVTDYYTCPMHPSVRSDHPGACPICGMTLVKKSSMPETGANMEQTLGEVALSPVRQVLANVATAVVERKSLTKVIRAVGTVTAAEPGIRRISARFPGRLDHLYLTYTGQAVRKGDPVADVYSPEAISAQEEFLLALRSTENVENGGQSDNLLAQAREKLVRWGFTGSQIAELQRNRKTSDVVTIYSPVSGTVVRKNVDPQHYANAGEDLYEVADLSTVWLLSDVYESELRSLKVGEAVEATAEAYPGAVFHGKVTFISPSVDPGTRTVSVRAEIPNAAGKLKTDMYMSALLRVRLPEAIAVPASAVLSTGQRNVVWVQKGAGVFEPRDVVLGERAEDYYQVLDGLAVGDTVVASGGYLVDSESQLETPGETHRHGSE